MTRVCTRCIYDGSTPGISFDETGVCNYCRTHEQMEQEYPTGEEGRKRLIEIAGKIKREQRNREFDCVIGVSGGCDSSFLCHIAKEELGLRPLAVHFDNTWNSKIAVENIHRVLKKLDIELWTYVMDNDEWNDLARAFLLSSVPEIDALTDVALTTTLYMAAEKHKVRYIFNGHSFRTEGMTPLGWFYFDGKYIDSIHKQYGKAPMVRFPNLWLRQWMKWLLQDYKRLRPLYYVDYRKDDTKKMLTEKYDWQWYGGHHMENRYTVFCDNFILPRKFGIDIRYVEFSALIRSGQMTREEALREIQTPPEFDEEILVEVKKRLGFTDEEFDEVLKRPKRTYRDFKTYHETFKRLRPFFYLMYKTNRVPKSFYLKYTR